MLINGLFTPEAVASSHTLLCLGSWTLMGLVRDEDVEAIA